MMKLIGISPRLAAGYFNIFHSSEATMTRLRLWLRRGSPCLHPHCEQWGIRRRRIKKWLWALFLLTWLPLSCENVNKTQGQVTTPPPSDTELTSTPPAKEATQETQAPSINVANVVLYPKSGSPITLTVEVAKTPEEKRKGLQGREALADQHGMWFVFDDDVQEPFWMKDTPVSLDIIFVDKDYKIVDIIANTIPNNSDILLVPHQKYRYALEVKAGSAALSKVSIGDRAEFRLGPP